MSRLRISHQSDGWLIEDPATPARQHGWTGAMVVGASGGKSKSKPKVRKPRKSRATLVRCDYVNAITCARAKGHKGAHESREALDNRNAGRRSREGIA